MAKGVIVSVLGGGFYQLLPSALEQLDTGRGSEAPQREGLRQKSFADQVAPSPFP